MSDFTTKIKILTDIVTEKSKSLTTLLNITQNQRTLLTVDEQDIQPQALEIFTQMTLEKKALIEKIVEKDQVFNTIFGELQDFEENAKLHTDAVRDLQQHVKQVTDLDMQVRLAEEENMAIMRRGAGHTSESPAPSQPMKKAVLDKYKSNAKPM